MTGVTNTFSANSNIIASELNTNFSDVVTLATAIGSDQLLGGITADKVSDKFIPSWTELTLVPFTTGTNYGSVGEFTMPTSMTTITKWQPVLKTGTEGFLCAITLYVAAMSTVSTSDPAVKFLLNGTTLLGGSLVRLAADDSVYLVAKNDPIANPLMSMADGDYIEIQMGPHSGSGASTCRGVTATFTMKYPLIG